jgi:flagellin
MDVRERYSRRSFIMRINHNISAMNTHRMMGVNKEDTSKSLEKLSSGLRINRAGDDAAGLAISEKMRGQIRGLGQASRNSQDGISMIQTAEGALNETQSILQRMRELSVQSGNDTNTLQDRTNIQSEVTALNSEIDRIASTTEFNTKKLLDGTMGAAVAASVKNENTNTAFGAAVTSASTFSVLVDAAGNNLGIVSTDSVTVSYAINGNYTTTTLVLSAAAVSLSSIAPAAAGFSISTGATAGNMVVTASTAGFAGAVTGLTITVKDSAGNVKNAATNVLSAFGQTLNAANAQANGSATFQIGANANQTLNLSISQMDSAALGVNQLKVGTQSQAAVSIKAVDNALQLVSGQRASLGAVQNRLEHTIANLDTSNENLQASESRIRDVDMAQEMMQFTKSNILSQASQAMLAQANQQPQGVLSLLR